MLPPEGHKESVEGGVAEPLLMADFDYESLLDRARENIPEEISNRSRWRLPAPQILIRVPTPSFGISTRSFR